MHGIQLKRHGSRVTILERDPRTERREAQAAGIGFEANMQEFLRRYNVTGR
jgi:2-polyprenyl-6-methoxyphenol hydroxylase-like FAD-dependent oxidoreductase